MFGFCLPQHLAQRNGFVSHPTETTDFKITSKEIVLATIPVATAIFFRQLQNTHNVLPMTFAPAGNFFLSETISETCSGFSSIENFPFHFTTRLACSIFPIHKSNRAYEPQLDGNESNDGLALKLPSNAACPIKEIHAVHACGDSRSNDC